MPSCEVFMAQEKQYRESVLPSSVTRRIAIEAAHPDYWYKFVGFEGRVIGVDRFGESAPAEPLFKEFGITTDKLVATAEQLLSEVTN